MINPVTVRVTHFNRKQFNGFVSREDARHQIFQALGHELSLHHGTFFKRPEDNGELFITFRLTKEIEESQLQFS